MKTKESVFVILAVIALAFYFRLLCLLKEIIPHDSPLLPVCHPRRQAGILKWRRKPPGASRLRNDANSPAYQVFFSMCFGFSTRFCLLNPPLPYHSSLPGPYYYWPGNPVKKPSSVSRYHFGGYAANGGFLNNVVACSSKNGIFEKIKVKTHPNFPKFVFFEKLAKKQTSSM